MPMLTVERLRTILDQFPRLKVAVFGDFYLDRYGTGTMEAISREAPVPIVRLRHRESNRYSPGGAGNTACNALALGARVEVVSAVGDDLYGREMRSQFHQLGIGADHLVLSPERVTPAFEKFYASAYHSELQQVSRIDMENDQPMSAPLEAQLREHLWHAVDRADVVIVADYVEVAGTGCVTDRVLKEVCAAAVRDRPLFIGDSRDRIGRFTHILGTPNDYEAAMAAGIYKPHMSQDISDQTVHQSGQVLTRALERELIITRGKRGMTVFDRDGHPTAVPAVPVTGPTDPTGAGDTVAAALAAALAAGASLTEAAEIGNLAARVTVQKLGQTGTASIEEIQAQWDDLHG